MGDDGKGRRPTSRGFGRSAILALAGAVSLATTATAGPFFDPGHPIASMIAWASDVDEIVVGPMDVAQPMLGPASWGDAGAVIGPALGDTNTVLSLGDGGHVTLYFDDPIGDGDGDDFAVFENGFWTEFGLFAELAFVEVSTDGVSFARFDARTTNAAPVVGLVELDPSDYDGLAGKHEAGLGTGFDLGALWSQASVLNGQVDLANIHFVRVIDVIGNGSTTDVDAMPIWDPYPSAFNTGGFDLDGVGVRNNNVPEPGALACLTAGVLLLAWLGRRRPGRTAARRAGQAGAAGLLAGACFATGNVWAATIDFEDLALAPSSPATVPEVAGGFTSGAAEFQAVYTNGGGWDYWYGFAASNHTDATTPGFGNQWSAITGGGAGGSDNYAVFFDDAAEDPRMVLPQASVLSSARFTNTTYAGLSMLDGDAFTDPFGGPSGDDADWLLLTIYGYDSGGAATGSVEFYLADYRFANNTLDYVVTSWQTVDLSGLGSVKELGFEISGSKMSFGYLDTPAYFAMDDIVLTPEPSTGLLVGLGLLGLRWRARGRAA